MNLLEDFNNPLWETKNIIYCYTNLINNKKYIGQTTMELRKRHNGHISCSYNENKNKEYNLYFHCAIRKYGIKNFKLEVLHIADKYSLDLLEIHYIEKWNLLDRKYGYNISSGGSNGNPFKGKTEKEMKEIFNEEWKNKISKTMKEKGLSEEHLKKMHENRTYKKGEESPLFGRHHSEETRKKISEKKLGYKNHMSKKCIAINLKTKEIIECCSITDACNIIYKKYNIKICHSNANAICICNHNEEEYRKKHNGKAVRTIKGFTFYYKDDYLEMHKKRW